MSSDLRLQVSIDDQMLRVLDDRKLIRVYPISSGLKGVGFKEGSFRTPTGRFRIAEKIGQEAEPGTIFNARIPVGVWSPDSPVLEDDLILSRILRIDGLDPDNKNTFDRYIYLHGTNREDLLGQPASHGCLRMANHDIVELFDLVATGTPLEIIPPTMPRGKLFFVDCDSTLSSIEGIDELARAKGRFGVPGSSRANKRCHERGDSVG